MDPTLDLEEFLATSKELLEAIDAIPLGNSAVPSKTKPSAGTTSGLTDVDEGDLPLRKKTIHYVPCPNDPKNHARIPEKSLEKHLAKCGKAAKRSSQEDLPFRGFKPATRPKRVPSSRPFYNHPANTATTTIVELDKMNKRHQKRILSRITTDLSMEAEPVIDELRKAGLYEVQHRGSNRVYLYDTSAYSTTLPQTESNKDPRPSTEKKKDEYDQHTRLQSLINQYSTATVTTAATTTTTASATSVLPPPPPSSHTSVVVGAPPPSLTTTVHSSTPTLNLTTVTRDQVAERVRQIRQRRAAINLQRQDQQANVIIQRRLEFDRKRRPQQSHKSEQARIERSRRKAAQIHDSLFGREKKGESGGGGNSREKKIGRNAQDEEVDDEQVEMIRKALVRNRSGTWAAAIEVFQRDAHLFVTAEKELETELVAKEQQQHLAKAKGGSDDLHGSDTRCRKNNNNNSSGGGCGGDQKADQRHRQKKQERDSGGESRKRARSPPDIGREYDQRRYGRYGPQSRSRSRSPEPRKHKAEHGDRSGRVRSSYSSSSSFERQGRR